jgi:energy-coupling factor transporter ATP-binding protein EcfA2
MSTTVNEKIAQVIVKRRKQKPQIEKELKKWGDIDEKLKNLEEALNRLIEYKDLPDELKSIFQHHDLGKLQKLAKVSIYNFEKVYERIKRSTINIGISGQARVGKSTLLQTIAGLTDEQVPTGEGIPVTAVRSRIFHSPTSQIANIKFHSYSSFRESMLKPYHDKLSFGFPPETPDEYHSYRYSLSDKEFNALDASSQGLYKRLKDMHDAFPSYSEDLHGIEMEKPLSELREFVAYPTKKQEDTGNCPRRYLAVREAKIECKFPKLDVENIGLIDLPGLGELTVGADKHHIQGLQNDVDLVLLVKRPAEGMAYWREEDAKAVDLLDQVRGDIKERKNFVIVVSNDGGCKQSLIDAMLGDVQRKANMGKILSTDAKSEESVYANVITPVLGHLTERLSDMDREIFIHAIEKSKREINNIKNGVNNLLKDLRTHVPSSSDDERLDELTKELHEKLAVGFKEIVDELFELARSQATEDEQFIKAVYKKEDELISWINNGLGSEDEEEWIQNAIYKMGVRAGSAGFAEDEFNRIRVHISNHFSNLDNHFKNEVKKFWKRIENVISGNMSTLLAGDENDLLIHFSQLLSEAGEECPTLSSAVNELLDLEIKYRTHLHPRVRKCLDELKYQIWAKSMAQIDADRNGAEKLYKFLKERAEFAVGESRKALLREMDIISSILHVSCEQFDDSFIRSGSSKKEFKRFGRSYRNEIWPEEFSAMGSENARISKVKKVAARINNILKTWEEADV